MPQKRKLTDKQRRFLFATVFDKDTKSRLRRQGVSIALALGGIAAVLAGRKLLRTRGGHIPVVGIGKVSGKTISSIKRWSPFKLEKTFVGKSLKDIERKGTLGNSRVEVGLFADDSGRIVKAFTANNPTFMVFDSSLSTGKKLTPSKILDIVDTPKKVLKLENSIKNTLLVNKVTTISHSHPLKISVSDATGGSIKSKAIFGDHTFSDLDVNEFFKYYSMSKGNARTFNVVSGSLSDGGHRVTMSLGKSLSNKRLIQIKASFYSTQANMSMKRAKSRFFDLGDRTDFGSNFVSVLRQQKDIFHRSFRITSKLFKDDFSYKVVDLKTGRDITRSVKWLDPSKI